MWSGSTPSSPRAGPTDLPDSFMKVWGSSTASWSAVSSTRALPWVKSPL